MNGKTFRALLVVAAVLAGAAFAACDDTGPSPIGVHYDDAGADTGGGGDDDTTADASDEAGDDGGSDEASDEAGDDSGGDAGDDADADGG